MTPAPPWIILQRGRFLWLAFQRVADNARPADFAYHSGMSRFLVFGPHPDDQELGMGGTIAKLQRQGHYVHLVDMTNGEPTPHGSVEIRARESAAAAKVLGVERTLAGLNNREVQHTL